MKLPIGPSHLPKLWSLLGPVTVEVQEQQSEGLKLSKQGWGQGEITPLCLNFDCHYKAIKETDESSIRHAALHIIYVRLLQTF